MIPLTSEQVIFARGCVSEWLSRCNSNPTPADASHSSALSRLLAGRKLLDKAPPTAYSYPWYELVENGEAEAFEVFVNEIFHDIMPWAPSDEKFYVVIDQSIWKYIETKEDGSIIAEWRDSGLRVHCTKIMVPRKSLITGTITDVEIPMWKVKVI